MFKKVNKVKLNSMFNWVKPAFANYRPSIAAFKISSFSFFSTYATVNV